jgi:nucleoside-diphosphate-sugar epimerase
MKRTLITGVGGFTGRYMADFLSRRGHEVYGIVHAEHVDPIFGVKHVFEADLVNFRNVTRVVEEVRPNHVVHLAGVAFVGHMDVEQIYRSNIVGTRQLLEALVGLSQVPQSILLCSSANVYGNAHGGVIDESATFAPANDYAISKVAMEYVATLYRDRLPLIVVRPFNYTGRGQPPQFLVPKIVAHFKEAAPAIELGNLDVARDFSDVRAVVEIYARLLDTRSAVGGTYNVCSGAAVTLQQVLDLVRRISGHDLEVRFNSALARSNEVRILEGSQAALERVIGTVPSIPLEETLGWMLDG